MNVWIEYASWIAYSSGYLLSMLVLLWFGRLVFDTFTSYKLATELTEKDNPAVGVLIVGYLLGLVAVICGLFHGEQTVDVPTIDLFIEEMIPIGIYGAVSILLLYVAGIINDRLILRKFSNHEEISKKQNVAVAVVMGATYMGSGLIIAGGIYGSRNILSLVAAFVLGNFCLVLYSLFYHKLTGYDDHKELGDRQNVAAGLAHGGTIIAYSLVLMKGAALPDYMNDSAWTERLIYWAYYAVAGLVLLTLIRIVCDRLFLVQAKMRKEIVEQQNINAGLMEAALAISFGLGLVFCL